MISTRIGQDKITGRTIMSGSKTFPIWATTIGQDKITGRIVLSAGKIYTKFIGDWIGWDLRFILSGAFQGTIKLKVKKDKSKNESDDPWITKIIDLDNEDVLNDPAAPPEKTIVDCKLFWTLHDEFSNLITETTKTHQYEIWIPAKITLTKYEYHTAKWTGWDLRLTLTKENTNEWQYYRKWNYDTYEETEDWTLYTATPVSSKIECNFNGTESNEFLSIEDESCQRTHRYRFRPPKTYSTTVTKFQYLGYPLIIKDANARSLVCAPTKKFIGWSQGTMQNVLIQVNPVYPGVPTNGIGTHKIVSVEATGCFDAFVGGLHFDITYSDWLCGGGHRCNNAIFNLSINDTYISQCNLNNQEVYAYPSHDGDRFCHIYVSEAELQAIWGGVGLLVFKWACALSYCHQGIGQIVITNDLGTILYSGCPVGIFTLTSPCVWMWTCTYNFGKEMNTSHTTIGCNPITMQWLSGNTQLKITKSFSGQGKECTYIKTYIKDKKP